MRKTYSPLEALAVHGAQDPDRVIFADLAGQRLTRQGLLDAVAAMAGRLAGQGIGGGQTVGLLVSDGIPWTVSLLAVNVTAPACLTRDLLPFLRCSPQAQVVNVGSMFGDIAFPYFAAYSASKFALRGLSDALRRELAEEGVAVTYVAPRATQTPAAKGFAHLVGPFAMKLDRPELVAAHILRGVRRRRAVLYPRGMERLFVLVQYLLPGCIDAVLKRQLAAYRARA